MLFKNFLYCLLVAVFALSACKKSGPKPSGAVDVYVAGYVTVGIHPTEIATYWKNGAATQLTDGTFNAEAFAVAVNGKDVYVLGSGGYWKNGVGIGLSGNTKAFVIIGNDVYVAGNVSTGIGPGGTSTYSAIYWKNGVAHTLTDGSVNGYANAITVIGNDVYVAGYIRNAGPLYTPLGVYIPGYHAAYWKNGVINMLEDTLADGQSFADGITVHGSDVYICGEKDNVNGVSSAIYWKNGVPTALPAANFASSLEFSNNDLYISGLFEISGGMYWKNGTPTALSDQISSYSNAMAVYGSDVYIAGRTFTDKGLSVASYWQNGVPVELLTDKLSFGNGITVVPH